nr:TonB-dependent receptor [Sphingobium fuliginis]
MAAQRRSRLSFRADRQSRPLAGRQCPLPLAQRGGVRGAPEFALPGYAVLDLRISLESPDSGWKFQLWGRNVTNKFYVTTVTHVVDTVARTTGMPATYGATLSYSY